MVRFPGSINHKEEYDEPFVKLLHFESKPIEFRPRPVKTRDRSYTSKPLAVDFNHQAFTRLDVLKKYRRDLDPKARALIRDRKAYEPDRSDQIFHIVVGLQEVGATLDEIACVVWDSPYFQDKHPDDIGALHAELSRILSKIEGAS